MMCVELCTLVDLVALLLFCTVAVIEDPTHCNYDRRNSLDTIHCDDDQKYNKMVFLSF
jgi:hypothetical protein